MPIETMGQCARRARECKLSQLCLLDDDSLTDNKNTLRLDEIEKMKKHIKGKRCVLDQDTRIVTNLLAMLDKEEEHKSIKEEDHFVMLLDKNKKMKKEKEHVVKE